MNKKDFLGLNTLISYIRENIIDNQNITEDMILEIKALLKYANSKMDATEKMDYADMLEIFKQCKGMIDDTVKGKAHISDNEKFASVCRCIRFYFEMLFEDSKENYIHEYCRTPSSNSVNVSTNVPADVLDEYNKKLEAIKQKENVESYREFTKLGAFSTYILAVAKGLIGFKKYGNQMYLVAKNGLLGTEEELILSDE